MPKAQEGIAKNMKIYGDCRKDLDRLLTEERSAAIVDNGDEATLIDATLLAAFFNTSLTDFID